MSMMETFKSDDYTDGRTKQAFKDQTDINKLLARAAKGETLSHLAKHGAVYGDFSDIDDLLTAHDRLQRGQAIFDRLPAEVKREFDQDVGKFYNFVNNPENRENLGEILPDLAKPGQQMPAPTRTPQTVAAEEQNAPQTPPEAPSEAQNQGGNTPPSQ